jgi:gas vesicle protein
MVTGHQARAGNVAAGLDTKGEQVMNKLAFFIFGLAAGAVVGILLAPQSGRATRSTIKDRSSKYSNDVSSYAGGKAKNVADKTRGYAHSVKGALNSVRGAEKPVRSYI